MDIALLNTLQGGNQASATTPGSAGSQRGGKSADDNTSPFASLLGKARGAGDASQEGAVRELAGSASKKDGSDLLATVNALLQSDDGAKLLDEWLASGDAGELDALVERLASQSEALGDALSDSDALDNEALAALLVSQLSSSSAQNTASVTSSATQQPTSTTQSALSLSDIQQRMLLIQQAGQGGNGDASSRQDLMARLTNAASGDSQASQSLTQLLQGAQGQANQSASQLQGSNQLTPSAVFGANLVQQAQSAANAQRGDLLATQGGDRSSPDNALLTGLGNATSPSGMTGSAANAAGSAASATPTATLTPQVGMNEWGQALGQQVVRMAQRGDQQVELRLHPAELGPMSVSLKMGDQQQANLQFFSAHGAVRHALEAAIPQLREALADSGIALGETSVGEQDQFQQQSDGQPGQPSREGTPGQALAGSDTGAEMPSLTETSLHYVTSSGINLYA
ncbi:flagellar hook-length control protein FliK [Chromohalobacter israelensis]